MWCDFSPGFLGAGLSIDCGVRKAGVEAERAVRGSP